MTPVRQVTIAPMFAGRKLEEIGWESVPMNDPRITAHPDWLENLQKWAARTARALKYTKLSALNAMVIAGERGCAIQ